MSLELSKPADMDNEIHQEEVPGQGDGDENCCLEYQEEE